MAERSDNVPDARGNVRPQQTGFATRKMSSAQDRHPGQRAVIDGLTISPQSETKTGFSLGAGPAEFDFITFRASRN
jgi:hypothetical protein